MSDYDLVVLGAGIAGIVATRFYLDVHPSDKVLVLERDSAVGGTWGKDRLYPGFKAQASARMCEFSDLPNAVPPEGIDDNNCPDSRYIAEYLDVYLDKHIYAGTPLRGRFLLNSIITQVSKEADDLWHIKLSRSGHDTEISTRKVIVATGTTSQPHVPKFKNEASFNGSIIHSINFGREWPAIQNPNIQKVVVIGAGKSAADMAYQFAKAGKHVTWIIRKSGKGPGVFASPIPPPGYLSISEFINTRAITSLFIQGLKPKNWFDWLLWNTKVGQAFQKWFDGLAITMAEKAANFDGRKDAREGFSHLRNNAKPGFLTIPAGLVQQPDFWDVVANQIDVMRNDIDRLEDHRIVFTDGSSIDADLIMLGTGYVDKFPFFSDQDCVALGLPHQRDLDSPSEAAEWKALESDAEKDIIAQYPILQDPPGVPKYFGDIDMGSTPYRLYRCAGPLNRDPSIAFSGLALHPNMFESSEVYATWAVGYLDGAVKLPDEDTMKKDIAYTNAYMRLRVPTYGRVGNFFLFDTFGHFERLLTTDLGLTSWNTKRWLAYWFQPRLPTDLKGLKDEYLQKHRSRN